MKHLVDFAGMEWIVPAVGVRYKAYVQGNQRIRLVEFSQGFVEPAWCLNGHAGYVLEGSFSIDFNGHMEHYQKGHVIFIPKGENDKHKVIMNPGGFVQLLLFEMMD